MKNKLRTSEGFTLIELMVTVGLLALLGLVASLSFDTDGWLAHYRLKGAARELFLNMQKARMNAIKENKEWAIVFDTNNPNRYLLCSDRGPDNSWSNTADNVVAQTVTLAAFGNGVAYGQGAATGNASDGGALPPDGVSFNNDLVVFNPRGLASNSGYCYLTNDRNGAHAVGALVSGVVRTKKWNGSAWE